jgi:hypothetical protein
LWFHIWPNAYKNDRTALTHQLVENNSPGFYFSKELEKGFLSKLNFKADGIQTTFEQHPLHQDIIKLQLPSPLLPGQKIEISTPFYVKLPKYVSRLGYINEHFHISQWFPKPAVYDKNGWHPMPYVDQGEFYSEFGNYTVRINVPEDFILAAPGSKISETTTEGIKTAVYTQENCHDFAWFTSRDYLIEKDTVWINGNRIELFAYYFEHSKTEWTDALNHAKKSLRTKSELVGPYPYPSLTLVEKPGQNDGGMEYPGITLISNASFDLIHHEIGHMWFYGILANNERTHPWMDEGMTSYYDNRINETSLNTEYSETNFISNKMPENLQNLALRTLMGLKKDQPIETLAEESSIYNYTLINYEKAAQWMKKLEQKTGTELFDSIMQTYFRRYAFKHVEPDDLKNIFIEMAGEGISEHFDKLQQKGPLDTPIRKAPKITGLFNLSETDKYHYISIAPSVGYNQYNGFMAGALIHNYTLPLPTINFIVTPLFAFHSNDINGLARLSFTKYFSKGNKIELFTGFSKFNLDAYKDSTGKNNFLDFVKTSPGIRYTVKSPSNRSSKHTYLQYKYYYIVERTLLFSKDPLTNEYNITYPRHKRYLNQIILNFENNRTLYPHNGKITVEHGKGFIRSAFEGNYFFNYPKSGGLNIRVFAGKFLYTNEKSTTTTFETSRHHFNMTGSNGYEDYTYSNYLIGRNAFNGWKSQQIAMRDGGFKIKTDLLSNKIGKSDDWLIAVNFTTSIPDEINPTTLMPLKIPLKIFADVGAYSTATNNTKNKKQILFNAGIQIDVLKTIHIYIPLIYSKEYDDYLKSMYTKKRFLKSVSFSIDLLWLNPRKHFPQFPI